MDSVLLGSLVIKICAGQPVRLISRTKEWAVELAQDKCAKLNRFRVHLRGMFCAGELVMRRNDCAGWALRKTFQAEPKKWQKSFFRRVCLHELVECCIVFYCICSLSVWNVSYILDLFFTVCYCLIMDSVHYKTKMLKNKKCSTIQNVWDVYKGFPNINSERGSTVFFIWVFFFRQKIFFNST